MILRPIKQCCGEWLYVRNIFPEVDIVKCSNCGKQVLAVRQPELKEEMKNG